MRLKFFIQLNNLMQSYYKQKERKIIEELG